MLFLRLYHASRKEKRAGSPCPSSMIFNLFFYPGDQFAGTNIKGQCDFPQRFKICLFRPIFDHCQVGACNSRKAAQHILGNSLFFAEVSNSLSNSKVIELHTITSFFFNSLREKEMFYVFDGRHYLENMLSYCLYQNRRVHHEKKIIVYHSYPGYDY